MKKVMHIVFALLLFNSLQLFSYEIIDEVIETSWGSFCETDGNKLYLLGGSRRNGVDFSLVFCIENGVVTKLPEFIEIDGDEQRLLTKGVTRLTVDNNGSLWLSGSNLYLYNGVKWSAITINDEFKAFRRFHNLAIGRNNELFFTTSVIDNDNQEEINFAELYKYENGKFTLIKKDNVSWVYSAITANRANPVITPLEEGTLLLNRIFNFYKRNGDEVGDTLQLLFFKDGEIVDRQSIPSYDNWEGNIRTNYLLEDNKVLWMANEGDCRMDLETKITRCGGSGLVTFDLETKEWYIFDSTNNYPFYNSVPSPAYSILSLNKNEKLLRTSDYREMYIIDKDKMVHPLPWNTLLTNAQIYRFDNQYTLENFELEMDYLLGKEERPFGFPFRHMLKADNGDIWMLYGQYLMRIPASTLSVEEQQLTNNSISLFPNPASEQLNIRLDNPQQIKSISIRNILGEEIFSLQDFHSTIDISNFANGSYFVNIHWLDGSFSSQPFIKLK